MLAVIIPVSTYFVTCSALGLAFVLGAFAGTGWGHAAGLRAQSSKHLWPVSPRDSREKP